MSLRLTNLTKQTLLSEQVEVAATFTSRLVGLLNRSSMAPSEALWFHQCNSIHTYFMRFAIDAIFVDEQLRVKKVCRNLKPWRLVLPIWRASSVFEMAAGQASTDRVNEGDQLHVGD